ncbi:DUF3696 domain-containing protein [Comamonas sp. 26]|uniref:AAA family ATPase n=1 Tax=Comamonas sp. 26 TaxID=2035201 RepID=UPI000C1823FA|nr:DUF3696 domain-containing protein [Comamonas sp. 26]PIG09091.1 uncharacterized protein DUF3696 [Comamonas sp. 26]
MHLKSFRLKNFKKFKDININLNKKIIILVGPNSVGKTSIIKAILALKQTFSLENDGEHFLSRGSLVELGSYHDFAFNHKTDNNVEFSGEIDFDENDSIEGVDVVIDRLSFTIEYCFNEETDQSILNNISFAIFSKGKKSTVNIYRKNLQKQDILNVSYFIDLNNIDEISENSLVIKALETFRTKNISNKKTSYKITKNFKFESTSHQTSPDSLIYSKILSILLDGLFSSIGTALNKNFSYIGPIRNKPERFSIKRANSNYVGAAGEHTPSVLTNLNSQHRFRSIFQKINSDFKKLFGKSLIINTSNEITRIRIATESSEHTDSINDVGFGISQILPIITQANLLEQNQVLILEQPELHLHPETQTKLSEILINDLSINRKFIIETHSEHLIRGLQLAVHSGKIKNDDISIIYIKKNSEENSIYSLLKLNENGDLADKWPAGFFDQAYQFTLKMLGGSRENSLPR